MANEASSRAFVTKAKELADAGQFGEAIQVLQDGLKKYPKLASARVLLGEIYWTSGDPFLARSELEQVIKAVPDNFAALRKLAVVYRDTGDHDAAVRSCQAVLRANPRDQEMKSMLAELQGGEDEGKAKAAADAPPAKAKQKATKEEAAAPEVSRQATDTVRMSRSPVAAKASSSNSAVEAEETDSETLAELYLGQGHRDKGLEVYRRLAAKNPDDARIRARIDDLLNEAAASEETVMLRMDEISASPSPQPEVPLETPAQAKRKAQVRRLEGWLQVVRSRRRT